MIKAVFIDIDDTLLDFHRCMVYSAKRAENEAGITLPDGFDVVFHRINNGLWKEIEEGKITTTNLFDVRWSRIFKELGITNFDGKTFEKLFLKNMESAAEPVDGAIELLEYLSPKYKIYAASNAPHNQQVLRLEKANMAKYFSGIFTSEFVGFPKPSVEFFNKCLELSVEFGENTMMIGDSVSADILGAKKVKMHTCLFNRKKSAMDLCSVADYCVTSLFDIKNIL